MNLFATDEVELPAVGLVTGLSGGVVGFLPPSTVWNLVAMVLPGAGGTRVDGAGGGDGTLTDGVGAGVGRGIRGSEIDRPKGAQRLLRTFGVCPSSCADGCVPCSG
ncbi:hypothetical protein [Pseudomonas sp. L13]|uniref:hypothetical protein n=1 Tax=Pseudomonas sp. L13 TaxID=343985 RepID=UPI00137ACF62|nr:hypothetical protein [Pseudomonas sp. L13]NCE91304.1 hypothetical protein [Pseudomonas sp. L13]